MDITKYLNTIFEEKTANVSPNSCTDLANSLDLLSSGIYTEEERFIFELLQNAVDSYEMGNTIDGLKIRIAIDGEYVVFMHNGKSFSCRDIEGICSVGNGDKSTDVQKIGYKGIGFKSVFMHSNCVTINSNGVYFKFDKQYWDDFFSTNPKSATGRKYKMPWQIIPIVTEEVPVDVDVEGYNVITYIKSANTIKIASKIKALMSDCQFLLFLRHSNIIVEYINGNEACSISKASGTVRTVSTTKIEQKVALYVNDALQSSWLLLKNDAVPVPKDKIADIQSDTKTPLKLQDARCFDLAFALLLDVDDNLRSLDRSVLYTYLPTSCKVNFPFLVNANFITDAGRQQLNVDAVWNQMVIDTIPEEYINWLAAISVKHDDYYRILPSQSLGINGLEENYEKSLDTALDAIAFVPNINGGKLLKASQCYADSLELYNAFSVNAYRNVLNNQLGQNYTPEHMINIEAGKALEKFGSKTITVTNLCNMLEHSEQYLTDLDVQDSARFCRWLMASCEGNSIPNKLLSHSAFLLDEEKSLVCPIDVFFPSSYRDDNSVADGAKVISQDLLDAVDNSDFITWLSKLGVQEMSDLSVIKNVLCGSDYINKENAIDVIRFIFDADNKQDIIGELNSSQKSNIRLLTQKGNLEYSCMLYLDSSVYSFGIENDVVALGGLDIFVSGDYVRAGDDLMKWTIFFSKLGVNNKIELAECKYSNSSPFWSLLSLHVDYAKNHEYNTSWDGRKFYVWPTTIYLKMLPFIRPYNNEYSTAKYIWQQVLRQEVTFERRDDRIFGGTGYGYTKNAYLADKEGGHMYLGENFVPWAIKNLKWLPGSDSKLHRIQDMLENSTRNVELCGKYFPTLHTDISIHDSWKEYLTFKNSLSLDECLDLLSAIENDKEEVKSNLDRVSRVYQELSDRFDFHEGTTDYTKASAWAKNHMILSSDYKFCRPDTLVLISDDLGKVEIENRVYRGNYIESRNERFVRLMMAFGVTFINSFTPVYEGNEDENVAFKKKLQNISAFLTILSIGKDGNMGAYEDKYSKMCEAIDTLRFMCHDYVGLDYADTRIEKKVYVGKNNFHYVGKLGLATIELMHQDIMKRLNISSQYRTALLTILQLPSIEEIKEYLDDKGFDTSLIQIDEELSTSDIQPVAAVVEDNFLSIALQQQYSEEAVKTVLDVLKNDGFETSSALITTSIVDGVTKAGVEYPLVIKSYKHSGYSFHLNPNEWEQLMSNPNSMLLLHRGNREVAKVSFSELFRNQDDLTLRFKLESFDRKNNIGKFADILRYFKGCKFDFSNLATTRFESMANYQLGQNNPNAFIDFSSDDTKLLD